jgi:hypothetical protein
LNLEFFGVESPLQAFSPLSAAVLLSRALYINPHLFIYLFICSALRPNSFERRKALVDGICEMLWQAGDRQRCCVALLEELACFPHDYRYRFDSITERVGCNCTFVSSL